MYTSVLENGTSTRSLVAAAPRTPTATLPPCSPGLAGWDFPTGGLVGRQPPRDRAGV